MSSTIWRRIIAIGIVALLLAALPAAAVQGQGKPENPGGGGGEGQAGTTLKNAEKTAEGFWEITYDWTVEKTASPDAVLLSTESSQDVTFTITATRTKVSERIGVRGKICVTNDGDRPTEGLTITDTVLYQTGGGRYQELTGATDVPVDVSAKPVLDRGESYCYPYEIEFTPVPGASYKNSAQVTITNHSGSLGTPKGPSPDAGFSLPASPTEFDETASLLDTLGGCPAGFTCTQVGDWGPWPLTNSATMTLTLTITNNSACDTQFTLVNTATLTEDDSGQEGTSSATVTVRAPACQVLGQCTYTQGYWKNHGKAWPASYSPDADFYSSGKSWMEVLLTPPAKGNAYYILAHQYIAAKLNVANGAVPPTAVAQAIADAEAWFTGRPTNPAPTGSDRTTALYLAGILAAFNEGTTGPGHCGDTPTTG
jgi:hypothetical protein